MSNRTALRVLLVAVVTAATSLFGIDSATARPLERCDEVSLIGHRGGGGATENTLGAALSGTRAGADTFETDLRLTRDGRWVLMHDATVDRTTRGRGRVSRMSYRALSRLRMADGQPARLSAAYVLAAYHRAFPTHRVQLELKVDASDRRMQRLSDMVKRIGLGHLASVTSFRPSYLHHFLRVDRHRLRVGLISNRLVATTTARAYDFVVLNRSAPGLGASYVDAMHRAGRDVGVWDLGATERTYGQMVLAGVDVYASDDVARAVQWCSHFMRYPADAPVG